MVAGGKAAEAVGEGGRSPRRFAIESKRPGGALEIISKTPRSSAPLGRTDFCVLSGGSLRSPPATIRGRSAAERED